MDASATAPSLPTTLRQPPDLAAYTPLAEHQSRTPATFFGGPPVLHYHGKGARAYVSRAQRAKMPWGESAEAAEEAVAAAAAPLPVMGDDMVQHTVDVFVGSDTLTLYCPAAACGVALPYPVIGLHAIKSAYTPDGQRVPTVYMQLELGAAGADEQDDGGETVELSIVVRDAAAAAAPEAAPEAAANTTHNPPQSVSEASKLFDAISACADLHPDRLGGGDDDDDDGYPTFFQGGDQDYEDDEYDEYADDHGDDDRDDGLEPIDGFRGVFRRRPAAAAAPAATATATATTTDLPPPLPGSGGWITAENAHQFFDEDGNWRGRGGQLGEGAGRVRQRDEESSAAAAATATATAASTTTTAASSGEANGTSADAGNGVHGDESESKRLRTE